MMKTKRMGVVLALLLTACGEETPGETGAACEGIEQVVEHVRQGLGSCTPNFKNEEPLAFSRSTCDAEFDSVCGDADQAPIQAYVTCLQAVAACNPANQPAFDDAIDDCLDTFQNSAAGGTCIELVVGD